MNELHRLVKRTTKNFKSFDLLTHQPGITIRSETHGYTPPPTHTGKLGYLQPITEQSGVSYLEEIDALLYVEFRLKLQFPSSWTLTTGSSMSLLGYVMILLPSVCRLAAFIDRSIGAEKDTVTDITTLIDDWFPKNVNLLNRYITEKQYSVPREEINDPFIDKNLRPSSLREKIRGEIDYIPGLSRFAMFSSLPQFANDLRLLSKMLCRYHLLVIQSASRLFGSFQQTMYSIGTEWLSDPDLVQMNDSGIHMIIDTLVKDNELHTITTTAVKNALHRETSLPSDGFIETCIYHGNGWKDIMQLLRLMAIGYRDMNNRIYSLVKTQTLILLHNILRDEKDAIVALRYTDYDSSLEWTPLRLVEWANNRILPLFASLTKKPKLVSYVPATWTVLQMITPRMKEVRTQWNTLLDERTVIGIAPKASGIDTNISYLKWWEDQSKNRREYESALRKTTNYEDERERLIGMKDVMVKSFITSITITDEDPIHLVNEYAKALLVDAYDTYYQPNIKVDRIGRNIGRIWNRLFHTFHVVSELCSIQDRIIETISAASPIRGWKYLFRRFPTRESYATERTDAKIQKDLSNIIKEAIDMISNHDQGDIDLHTLAAAFDIQSPNPSKLEKELMGSMILTADGLELIKYGFNVLFTRVGIPVTEDRKDLSIDQDILLSHVATDLDTQLDSTMRQVIDKIAPSITLSIGARPSSVLRASSTTNNEVIDFLTVFADALENDYTAEKLREKLYYGGGSPTTSTPITNFPTTSKIGETYTIASLLSKNNQMILLNLLRARYRARGLNLSERRQAYYIITIIMVQYHGVLYPQTSMFNKYPSPFGAVTPGELRKKGLSNVIADVYETLMTLRSTDIPSSMDNKDNSSVSLDDLIFVHFASFIIAVQANRLKGTLSSENQQVDKNVQLPARIVNMYFIMMMNRFNVDRPEIARASNLYASLGYWMYGYVRNTLPIFSNVPTPYDTSEPEAISFSARKKLFATVTAVTFATQFKAYNHIQQYISRLRDSTAWKLNNWVQNGAKIVLLAIGVYVMAQQNAIGASDMQIPYLESIGNLKITSGIATLLNIIFDSMGYIKDLPSILQASAAEGIGTAIQSVLGFFIATLTGITSVVGLPVVLYRKLYGTKRYSNFIWTLVSTIMAFISGVGISILASDIPNGTTIEHIIGLLINGVITQVAPIGISLLFKFFSSVILSPSIQLDETRDLFNVNTMFDDLSAPDIRIIEDAIDSIVAPTGSFKKGVAMTFDVASMATIVAFAGYISAYSNAIMDSKDGKFFAHRALSIMSTYLFTVMFGASIRGVRRDIEDASLPTKK